MKRNFLNGLLLPLLLSVATASFADSTNADTQRTERQVQADSPVAPKSSSGDYHFLIDYSPL